MTQVTVAPPPLKLTRVVPDRPPTFPMMPYNVNTDLCVPTEDENQNDRGVMRNAPYQHGTWVLQPQYNYAVPFLADTKGKIFWTRALLPGSNDFMNTLMMKPLRDVLLPDEVRFLHCLRVFLPGDHNNFAVIVIDMVNKTMSHEARHNVLANSLPPLGVRQKPDNGKAYLVPSFTEKLAEDLWIGLHEMNLEWKESFYRGIIAKQADAEYFHQLNDHRQASLRWQAYPFNDVT